MTTPTPASSPALEETARGEPGPLVVEWVEVGSLELDPQNRRRHPDRNLAAIEASLRRFGQREPLVVWRGRVMAGNGRLEVMRDRLGWSRVSIARCPDGWSEGEARAYAIAANRTGELAEWDEAGLAADLEAVRGSDAALFDALGFGDDELEELLAATSPRPARTDPDAVPAVPVEAVSTPGDVWALGPHRLIVGDSRDRAVVDSVMGGGMAAMVWTDPPYGVDYAGKTKARLRIENDALGVEGTTALLRDALGNALAYSRKGAAWYVASPCGPEILPFAFVLTELGIWRQSITWVKDRFVLSRGDYHWRHELVHYGWTPGEEPAALPLAEYDDAAETVLYGWTPGAAHQAPPDRRQDTVWRIARPSASEQHPTMKPVELIARALRNSSKPGAVVLDPFGGSGSTLIACHQEGRVARLVELDPRYCDVICARWQAHTGQLPVRERDGATVDFDVEAA